MRQICVIVAYLESLYFVTDIDIDDCTVPVVKKHNHTLQQPFLKVQYVRMCI